MAANYAPVRLAVNAMLILSILLASGASAGSWALTFGPAREAALARSWPTTPAVIVDVTDHLDDGYRCRFSYQVNGRTYESSRQALQPKVIRYPRKVGDPATCFVDPADPSNAVLDREAPFESEDSILLAVALVSVAFLVKSLLVRFSILRVTVDVLTGQRLTYREMR